MVIGIQMIPKMRLSE